MATAKYGSMVSEGMIQASRSVAKEVRAQLDSGTWKLLEWRPEKDGRRAMRYHFVTLHTAKIKPGNGPSDLANRVTGAVCAARTEDDSARLYEFRQGGHEHAPYPVELEHVADAPSEDTTAVHLQIGGKPYTINVNVSAKVEVNA